VKFPENEPDEKGVDESAPPEPSSGSERKPRRKRLEAERCEGMLLDGDLAEEEALISRLRERGFRLRELTRGRILRAALRSSSRRCGIESAFRSVLEEEEVEREVKRRRKKGQS